MTSEVAVYDETGTVEAEVRDYVDAHIVTFQELAAADTAPGMTDGGDYVKAAFLSGRDAVVIAFAAGDIQCLSVTTGALVALLAGTLARIHRKYGRSCGATGRSAKSAALYLPIEPDRSGQGTLQPACVVEPGGWTGRSWLFRAGGSPDACVHAECWCARSVSSASRHHVLVCWCDDMPPWSTLRTYSPLS
jgi:hypothetical protein